MQLKKFLISLSSLAVLALWGCESPSKKVTTVTTSSSTTTIARTPPASFSVDSTAGTVTFQIPAHVIYTVEWHVNSRWNQRVKIISDRAGVVGKGMAEPSVTTMMWRRQLKTHEFPEIITVRMDHKDDAGNWFPSSIRTRALPSDNSAVRFVLDSESHPNSLAAASWDDSQLVFEW